MASRGTLKGLRDKVDAMKPGDQLLYYSSTEGRRSRGVFEYFREANDNGVVLLFQRSERDNGENVTHYYAQKLSRASAKFIARVGKF